MILTKIKLENYGLFSGENDFDLVPRVKYNKTRSVILFGGKNGAGKTTFLDAIRLLLYGRRSLGAKPSQREYDEYLLARVHRNKKEKTRAKYAKIGLEFEHVLGGEKHLFYAERTWEVRAGDKIKEWFKVQKDGEDLEDMGMEHQESFIAEIVPERLSQLFFFDGEKIKGIAEDISSNAAIAEAIQSLLGLDAVLSLKSDLSVYKSRILKHADPDQFKSLLGVNTKEREKLSKQLETVEDEKAELTTKIEGVENDIRKCEKELSERGGTFAGSREKNVSKAAALKIELEQNENVVRECLEGCLPFAMCATISTQLLEELALEESIEQGAIASRHIEKFFKRLQNVVSSKQSGSIAKSIGDLIDKEYSDYCAKLVKQSAGSGDMIQHGMSPRDSHRIADLLGKGVDAEVTRTMIYLKKLEEANKELHKVNRDLEKAPDEVDVKEYFDRLGELNRDLGALKEQAAKIDEKERQLVNQLAMVEREGERLSEKIKAGGKDQQKLEYIKRMGPALDAYKDRLTQVKINTLQAEVTECFNRLARKSDFVKGIIVDSKTFQVSVVDAHGRAIPKEDLSSGEKQIFAISMLWGLARTSGRPLPVVVDTPLGRLDSDHRIKLIENYFPEAGHQVILLSTDTEVDKSLFEKLSPAISHTYHLEYDQDEGKTGYTEAYFWRSRTGA